MNEPSLDQTPSAAPLVSEEDKRINALIEKYRPQINQARELDSAHQQDLFRELGVDPKALEAHYAELQKKDLELRKKDRATQGKVLAATWASFGAGVGGAAALTAKYTHTSKLVRWVSVALSGMAAALGGSFLASRVLAGKTRSESRELDQEARKAFDRELAVALENRALETGMSSPAPAQAAETPIMPAVVPVAASVPKRDVSFAAQAGADKAAATININIRT